MDSELKTLVTKRDCFKLRLALFEEFADTDTAKSNPNKYEYRKLHERLYDEFDHVQSTIEDLVCDPISLKIHYHERELFEDRFCRASVRAYINLESARSSSALPTKNNNCSIPSNATQFDDQKLLKSAEYYFDAT